MERQNQEVELSRQPEASVSKGRRHAQLRAATWPVHQALDAFTLRSGYFAGRDKFAAYLERLLVFHRAFDKTAEAQDTFGWRSLWRVDQHPVWISQELQTLSAARLPSTKRVDFVLQGRSALLGSLYVLCGSALGARMLQKMTAEQNMPAVGGSSYLAALAQSVRWADFLAFLEAADIGGDEAGMIDGALATFRAVHASLEMTA